LSSSGLENKGRELPGLVVPRRLNRTNNRGWGARELAEKAGVTANTATRIGRKAVTMDRLQRALEMAGVEFIDDNDGGPGGAAQEATAEEKGVAKITKHGGNRTRR
jgi:hypothetical protein